MKREMFFAISGAVGILFGLAFLFVPEMSLRTYGVPAEPHNLMEARYFGSALLAFGLVVFLARETQDAIAIRALLASGVVGDIAGAIISATAGSLQNRMAWLSVVIYVVFAAASAYYLVAERTQPQVKSA